MEADMPVRYYSDQTPGYLRYKFWPYAFVIASWNIRLYLTGDSACHQRTNLALTVPNIDTTKVKFCLSYFYSFKQGKLFLYFCNNAL